MNRKTESLVLAAVVASITTRRAAIAAVRAEANALIYQSERRAAGADRGAWRDDMRAVECNAHNTIAATTRQSVAVAFALSAKFSDDAETRMRGAARLNGRSALDEFRARCANAATNVEGADIPRGDFAHPVADELQSAGIIEPVALAGLPEGVAAFSFIGGDDAKTLTYRDVEGPCGFLELVNGVEVNGYESADSRAYWVDYQYGDGTHAAVVKNGRTNI